MPLTVPSSLGEWEHDELDFTAQAFLLDSQELGFVFLRSKWVKQL